MYYSHTDLPDAAGCIRLLFLLPEANGEQLHGCLIPYQRSRDKIPQYDTVSYTWGDEEPTCEIQLANGTDKAATNEVFEIYLDTNDFRPFKIRPNLESALRLFRHEKNITKLWVDAICINQTNDDEKALQVRHMNLVYQDRQLKIWLGERSENSDLAVEMVNGWREYTDEHGTSEGNAKFLASGFNTQAHWQALWDLIGRPWFTRRWIVQECVLSGGKGVFLGTKSLDWQSLAALVYASSEPWHPWNHRNDIGERQRDDNVCRVAWLARGGADGSGPYYPIPVTLDRDRAFRNLHSACLAAWAMYHEHTDGNVSNKTGSALESEPKTDAASSLTLEALLERFGGYFSTDPRDGVYAFISMATDIEPSEWIPDYTTGNSASDVYEKAVTHIIRHSGSLDVICRRVLEVAGPGLSTWLPCFGPGKWECSSGDGHSHTIDGYRTKSLTTFGQPSWHQKGKVYHASGDEEPTYTIEWLSESRSQPDGELRWIDIEGWVVDKIEELGPWALTLRNANGGQGFNFPSDWGVMMGLGGWDPPNFPDAFCRAITGNRLVAHEDGLETVKRVPDNWLDVTRRYLDLGSVIEKENYDTLNHVRASIMVMLADLRVFAITSASMGFVPRNSQPGDLICVLTGCSVPVVVRRIPSGDEEFLAFILIGECYIEGLMEGEFLARAELEGLERKEMNFC